MSPPIPHRVRYWLRYPRLFFDPPSALSYYRCLHAGTRSEAVPLRVRGVPLPLWCRPGTTDASVLWSTFGEGYHRPRVPIREGGVIVDLGANVGYTMVDFALRYTSARVFGVEMDSGNAEMAARNVAPFGARCTLVHAAVWTSDGTVRYDMGDPPAGEWGYRIGGGAREAPALRMATLLDRFGIERVDFLKMDIEGAELELFSEGAPWLSRVDALYVEVHSRERTATEALGPALARAGFRTEAHPEHPGGVLAQR